MFFVALMRMTGEETICQGDSEIIERACAAPAATAELAQLSPTVAEIGISATLRLTKYRLWPSTTLTSSSNHHHHCRHRRWRSASPLANCLCFSFYAYFIRHTTYGIFIRTFSLAISNRCQPHTYARNTTRMHSTTFSTFTARPQQ